MLIEVTTPAVSTAVAVAPDPPPPDIVTVGGEANPVPPFITRIRATVLKLRPLALTVTEAI